jgi:hypothetical protein
MPIEYILQFGVEVCFTILILQLHLDVTLELVVLGEYRYHRDLKRPPCQSLLIKLHVDTPFLSGQISSKCFKSSSGRSLSIGMQYLKTNFCEFAAEDTQGNKPYRMQSIRQSLLLRLTTDEILDDLQLILTATLKSAGIVKNITLIFRENEFVLDAMHAALQLKLRSAVSNKSKAVEPLSWGCV